MCHKSVADFDVEFFAPILKLCACELSAIIRDNPVWNTEFDHNILEEFLCFGSYDPGNRFDFNPLGEFVDGDEEMGKTTQRSCGGCYPGIPTWRPNTLTRIGWVGPTKSKRSSSGLLAVRDYRKLPVA